jgi:hypothetical protein
MQMGTVQVPNSMNVLYPVPLLQFQMKQETPYCYLEMLSTSTALQCLGLTHVLGTQPKQFQAAVADVRSI